MAKALCVVSTRSPSSSLQKEGERVFLGLSSINSDRVVVGLTSR